ncbi:MAG: MATE family efflux transporter, partial [Phycisphaerales bacterium]|nr:MATE family efflux transporter [Phycisphaerales bacterium]
NTYVSQNLGAGRPERGAAYAWNGLWLGAGVWLLVLVPYGFLLPHVFDGMRSLILDNPGAIPGPVLEMEVTYGRILVLGMLFTICARGLSHYFYGMHRPWVVMVSAIAANVVNIVLCWLMVADRFGWSLGVAGAGYSTVIGGVIELAIPFAVMLSPRWHRLYRTRSQWRPSLSHMRDLFRIGWPAGVMWGNEIVCWWIFMSGLVPSFDEGRRIPVNNAAGWAVLQYMHLSFMPAVGLSIAVTAIVGKCVGMGRHDLAARRAWFWMGITMGYMGLCALCFVFFGHAMIGLFVDAREIAESATVTLDAGEAEAAAAEIVNLGARLLILAAVFQLFDAVAITLSGALRGAGDTIWPGVYTVVLSWTLIVAGGWTMVHSWPELGATGPWIMAAAYIIVLAIALFRRFIGGGWKRLKLVRLAEEGHDPGEFGFSFQGSETEMNSP